MLKCNLPLLTGAPGIGNDIRTERRDSPRSWSESAPAPHAQTSQRRLDGLMILQRYALMRRRLLYLDPFRYFDKQCTNLQKGFTSITSLFFQGFLTLPSPLVIKGDQEGNPPPLPWRWRQPLFSENGKTNQ